MKRLLGLGAVVAVFGLAAVVVGGAVTSAQDNGGPVSTFLSKLADKLGVSEDKLNTAVEETQNEMIDEAVADGTLTQEQADQLKERVGEGGFVFPFRGMGPGHGWGEGGIRGVTPEAAAEVLGMTVDELRDAMSDGSTLAEVAEAQGMSVDAFETALLDQVQTQLDQLVADGTLTQTQADEQFQRVEDNIDDIVNSQGCLGGFGGPHRGPGGPWFGPPADETPESTALSGTTA
jgi:polyhydroxyalkanoate synthesis regulator phasin